MKTILKTSIVVFAGATCLFLVAHAWPRRHYSDQEIVARAELIVVGKVQPGSLVFVPHKIKGDNPFSWENHLNLLVSEVLKGTNVPPSLTVSLHYGLEPLVGGYSSNVNGISDIRQGRRDYPPEVIEVIDIGASRTTHRPITGDLRTNHLWLLRHATRHNATDTIGAFDPEDIQPVGRAAALLKYLP